MRTAASYSSSSPRMRPRRWSCWLERVGGRRARGEPRCVPPFSCTVNRTISSRISCHITFFSCHISWKTELIVFACLYRKVVRIGRSSTVLFVITANPGGMETNRTGKSVPNSSLKSRTFFPRKAPWRFEQLISEEVLNGGLSHTTNAPRVRPGGAPRVPGRLGRARGCVRTAQEHGGHSRALVLPPSNADAPLGRRLARRRTSPRAGAHTPKPCARTHSPRNGKSVVLTKLVMGKAAHFARSR